MSMRGLRTILTGSLIVVAIGLLAWLSRSPGLDGPTPASAGGTANRSATRVSPATPAPRGVTGSAPAKTQDSEAAARATGADPDLVRIGIVPERNIFEQRRRYQALTGELTRRLSLRFELVTVSSYQGVMEDFKKGEVDAAFLGSLVAVLTMDRLAAQALVKPVESGDSTYRGVLFVREDSAIRSLADLSNQSLGMVRTTTAGNLFPIFVLKGQGLLGDKMPKLTWLGTHDDVILEVAGGRLAAGAAKDDRLDAMAKEHPEWRLRRLAESKPVPSNALLVRADVAEGLGQRLTGALLALHRDTPGQAALKTFGASQFVPVKAEDYAAVYEMVEGLGEAWEQTGIGGRPPRRPQSPETKVVSPAPREGTPSGK